MVRQPTEKVYIVEDDDDLRHWLARGLGDHGFKTKSFASIRDFNDALPDLRPGCVMCDLRIPGGGAIELLEQLSPQWMTFPIIVMTAFSDVSVAVAAMKHGAFDFIEKPFTEDAVIELIHSVTHRVNGVLSQRRKTDGLGEAARRLLLLLTPREREVMNLLVNGYANKDVAIKLGLSTRTVEVYRAQLLKKMQVRNLTQLASMVFAAAPDIVDSTLSMAVGDEREDA